MDESILSAEMDDNKAIIDSLKKKVSRIIEDNRRLRSEVRELTAERDTVILEKRAAETEIRQLGRRNARNGGRSDGKPRRQPDSKAQSQQTIAGN